MKNLICLILFISTFAFGEVGWRPGGIFHVSKILNDFLTPSGSYLSGSRYIYVDIHGSDTTGDGSQSNPYGSLFKALSTVTATSGLQKIVIRMGPGQFSEPGDPAVGPNQGNIELNIGGLWIEGEHQNATIINCTGAGHTFVIGPNYAKAPNSSGGAQFHNIRLNSSCDFNMDMTQSTAAPTRLLAVLFRNALVLGNFSFTGRPGSYGNFGTADEAVFFGEQSNTGLFGPSATFHNAAGLFQGATIGGNVTFDMVGAGATDVGSVQMLDVNASSSGPFITVDASAGAAGSGMTVETYGTVFPSGFDGSGPPPVYSALPTTTLTAGANFIQVATDDSSFGTRQNVTKSGNVTFTYVKDAYGLFANPVTPGNWGTTPTTVGDALDFISSSITGLGNTGAQGNLSLFSTSNGTKGNVVINDASPLVLGNAASVLFSEYAGGGPLNLNSVNIASDDTVGYPGFVSYEGAGSSPLSGNFIFFNKVRGTNALPNFLQSGDSMGGIDFTTTSNETPNVPDNQGEIAGIGAAAEENHSSSAHGTRIGVAVTELGTNNLMFHRFKADGSFQLGNNSTTSRQDFLVMNDGQGDMGAYTQGGTSATFPDCSTATGGCHRHRHLFLEGGVAATQLSLQEAGAASDAEGLATLVAGTATVSSTLVTANSRIYLTCQDPNAGTPGAEYVSARTPGTSFVITSTNAGDTCKVAWMIVEPHNNP